MTVKGRIVKIGKTETFGQNGFRKRELVVETIDQYPQKILLEFIQDRCDLLDSYRVGEEVEVNINIRGREWTNPEGEVKYFNSIQGWRIKRMGGQSQSGQSSGSGAKASDDLPF